MLSPATQLKGAILTAREKRLAGRIGAWPRERPYLSDLSDCDRQIVYSVSHWQKRERFDTMVQARLDAGNVQETAMKIELAQLGFEVESGQERVMIKGKGGVLLATGRIDGKIRWDVDGKRMAIPIEIKSMNPQIYNSLNSIEDFQRKPWLRKYLRQLQLYMFGNDAEMGLFLCTDCLGHWKIFELYLDLGECEFLLQRLERARGHLDAGTLPDRIPYNDAVCGKCPFVTECLPDIAHEGMVFVDNEDLARKLLRRDGLVDLAKEFEALDEEIKETAKAVGKDMRVADFSIILRKGERTSYNVPDEVKKGFAEKVPTTTVKIVRDRNEPRAA